MSLYAATGGKLQSFHPNKNKFNLLNYLTQQIWREYGNPPREPEEQESKSFNLKTITISF
jgi:hypothetical protein